MSFRSTPTALWGVDIGGTNIGVCLGTAAGRRLAHDAFANDPRKTPQVLMDRALRRLRGLSRRAGLRPAALGLACPGPMSSKQGRFLDPPNMPAWHGFKLIQHIRGVVDVPVAMMNDANACALAEWKWGAARGCRTAIFLTMSTGMGAGLIVDGRVLEGADHLAGEIGHIRLDPDGPVGFGKRGSVEGYLSGPGMVQLARAEAVAAYQAGQRTRLLPRGLASLDDITTRALCRAARAGDAAAHRAVDRSATALGRLAAMLTDLLNPDIIVLGTIGSAWPELFIPRARAVVRAEAIARAARRVRVVPSGLGARRGDLSAIATACRASASATRQ